MTVELFGLHLRNLITFLYPTRNQQDTDVYARDYFSDKGEWERIAPPLSATLDTARRRANKELGHLTTERIDGFQDRKKWGIASDRRNCTDTATILFLCQQVKIR